MTREEIAARIMAGFAAHEGVNSNETLRDNIAKTAVEWTDALIAELARTEPETKPKAPCCHDWEQRVDIGALPSLDQRWWECTICKARSAE